MAASLILKKGYMQKQWYIIYTKPKSEKKVAALLTKRKINNFCPINCKQYTSLRRRKLLFEPLFNSYVFIHIFENEIVSLKQIEGIVSLVFWKGKPATVRPEEIQAIKDFVDNHQNVILEQVEVNVNEKPRFINSPLYTIDGKIMAVKNKVIKLNLPSIGYMMIADIDTKSVIGRKISFGNNRLQLQ